VINVAILSVIRRWHVRDRMTIREFVRRTGISRNTIRKYLATDVVDPRYPKRRSAAAPASSMAWPPPCPAGGGDREGPQTTAQHQADACRPQATRLYYTGSYDRVTAYARTWLRSEQERARTAGRGTSFR
jgi:hypothetical protein